MEEDDFGIGNIGLIEDDVKVKTNPIPVIEYTPKIRDTHWFLQDSYKEIKKEKDTANKRAEQPNVVDREKKVSIKTAQYKIDHLYAEGKYRECLEELEYLKTLIRLKKKQDYAESLVDVEIRCYFKLQDYQQSIKLIKNVENTVTVVKQNPLFRDTNLLYILAQCYHNLNLYNESKIEYQRCLSINNRLWEWWMNLSLVYLSKPLSTLSKETMKEYIKTLTVEDQSTTTTTTNSDSNNSIVDISKFISNETLKELNILNRILGYRCLAHSSFLLGQSIISKRHYSNTKAFVQIKSTKSVLDTLIQQLLQCADLTEDVISSTYIHKEEIRSNCNPFEMKWLIDFKIDSLKEPEYEEEERDENPFNL
ncbi:hypothetical protein CYY_009111 [Polysphondylium violaceum]|uniref:Uncharacterized protein n=1 Tax=Polysphondylium violaceum TaxID=133409 RepID=A0A8J4UWD4_9MYCE|nr:hypothetical protein CYY_009111 [Polysphondylium violaceum]